MKVPMILKKQGRKYILDKIYNEGRYALYSNMSYGYKECFKFDEIAELYVENMLGGTHD